MKIHKVLMTMILLPGAIPGQWSTCPGTTSATCTGANVGITGTTGLSWGSGLLTVGASTTGGSLFVNTPSLSGGYFSGLGVAGSYGTPDKRSVVNINAYGPYSGGNYGADLAFSTTFNTALNEVMRITATGSVGIGTTAPQRNLHIAGANAGIYLDSTGGQSSLQFADAGSQKWNFYKTGSATNDLSFHNGTTDVLYLQRSTGNVGIGTTAPPYKLAVKGTIGAQEVIVTTSGWSDYVFAPGYQLQPLSQTAAYIEQNHHLPDIPSAEEVAKKGVSIGDMQAKLLAKIEELTLHVIELDNRNSQLEKENRDVVQEMQQLKRSLQK